MNEIELTILDGTIRKFESTELHLGVDDVKSNAHLKEIAVVIECLKKEQEKIMNRQRDEAQKFKTNQKAIIKVHGIELSNGVQILPFKNGIRIHQKDGKSIFQNTYPISK